MAKNQADDQPAKPAEVLAYEARTERLTALATFAAYFTPAIGQRSEAGVGAVDQDAEASDAVRDARDRALVAAFEQIESLARASD